MVWSAASITAWALAPPKPNELTPTICPAATTRASGTSRRFRLSNGIAGLGVSQCREAGTIPRSSTSIAFSRPAMPLAASR